MNNARSKIVGSVMRGVINKRLAKKGKFAVAAGFGAAGVLVAGALLCLGVLSLVLSNVTLHLQSERAQLREALDGKVKKLNNLRDFVAERERIEHIKNEADAMGLVATGRVSFYESISGHLTSR